MLLSCLLLLYEVLLLNCREGLGEGYDRDVAFASSLEMFGGGHSDPISVAFGGSSMLLFTFQYVFLAADCSFGWWIFCFAHGSNTVKERTEVFYHSLYKPDSFELAATIL